MDVLIVRLEEALEIKIQPNDLSLFKKEFESFFLVPLKTIEHKMLQYLGFTSPPTLASLVSNQFEYLETSMFEDHFEISLIVLLNRILEEWELFLSQVRKRLLKQFIDFDANLDGVLTLDEFRDLMKNLEGSNIPNERVIMLFNEALEMTS